MNRLKTKLTTLILSLLFVFSASAQNFKYKTTSIDKKNYVTYLGTFNGYHYYKSGFNEYSRFATGNSTAPAESFEIKMDDKKEGSYYMRLVDGKLLVLGSNEDTPKDAEISTFSFHMYYFDLNNGKKIDKKLFSFKDSSKYYFTISLDTMVEKIFIKKSDSVYHAFNYKFEEIQDKTKGVYKSKPAGLSDFMMALNRMLRTMNLGGSLSFDLGSLSSTTNQNDSTSLDNYTIAYETRQDKDIYYFEGVIQKILIKSKNKDNKVKSVEFGIDIDKSVIDVNYREYGNGNLMLIGKYMVKGNSSSEYGMFSAIYDKELNEVKPVKYFDLSTIRNFTGSVPSIKYIGFIFSRLFNEDYEFYLEDEKTFIFTYQKSYTNLQDHIYLLKVEGSGQITVNIIYNQQLNQKKSSYEPHVAVRAGNSIHILFYDNVANMGQKIRDIEGFTVCNMKKKTCVLAYTTYTVLDDEFTKKTQIADKKAMKVMPHLRDIVTYYDPKVNQNTLILEGWDKKGKVPLMYTYYFTE